MRGGNEAINVTLHSTFNKPFRGKYQCKPKKAAHHENRSFSAEEHFQSKKLQPKKYRFRKSPPARIAKSLKLDIGQTLTMATTMTRNIGAALHITHVNIWLSSMQTPKMFSCLSCPRAIPLRKSSVLLQNRTHIVLHTSTYFRMPLQLSAHSTNGTLFKSKLKRHPLPPHTPQTLLSERSAATQSFIHAFSSSAGKNVYRNV